jgi:hypothetical protein
MGTQLLVETTKEDVNGMGRGRHNIIVNTRLFHQVETEKLPSIYQVAGI